MLKFFHDILVGLAYILGLALYLLLEFSSTYWYLLLVFSAAAIYLLYSHYGKK